MDQISGGRPHIDINALSLLEKGQLSAIGEPGTYRVEWSWEIRNPEAFRAAASKVIGNADAPLQHNSAKGTSRTLSKRWIDNNATPAQSTVFVKFNYVGESANVPLRLPDRALAPQERHKGRRANDGNAAEQNIKEEVGASCMVYQTDGGAAGDFNIDRLEQRRRESRGSNEGGRGDFRSCENFAQALWCCRLAGAKRGCLV